MVSGLLIWLAGEDRLGKDKDLLFPSDWACLTRMMSRGFAMSCQLVVGSKGGLTLRWHAKGVTAVATLALELYYIIIEAGGRGVE